MSKASSSSLVALFFAVAFGVGCDPIDESSPGALGHARFEYESLEDCVLGCTIDHEVLAGAEVDVSVTAIRPEIPYDVKINPADIADVKVTDTCHEANNCREALTLVTKRAGDAHLEMYNALTGELVDFVVVKVRDPASIETKVKVNRSNATVDIVPSAAGDFEVKLDDDVQLVSNVLGASGAALLFTRGAMAFEYSDANVVGPSFELFGESHVQLAKAKTLGTSRVVVKAGPSRAFGQQLAFRVVK